MGDLHKYAMLVLLCIPLTAALPMQPSQIVHGADEELATLLKQALKDQHRERNGISPQRNGSRIFSGRDLVEIGSSSNELEINERIGEIRPALTDMDLTALESGTVQGIRRTPYEQTIRFNNTNGTLQSPGLLLGHDLVFEDGAFLFEYEIKFPNGLTSTINGTLLRDIDNEPFVLIGVPYTLIRPETRHNGTRLTFLHGHPFMITENTKTTQQRDGKQYHITALMVSEQTNTVKLKINEEITQELSTGEFYTFADGMTIAVQDIVTTGKDVQASTAQLFLANLRIELEDTNHTDNQFEQGVAFNAEREENAFVQIRAQQSRNELTIDSITYRYQLRLTPRAYDTCADYDTHTEALCLSPGQDLLTFLPHPTYQLWPNWNIHYGGTDAIGNSPIQLYSPTPTNYRLAYYNTRHIGYNFPLVDNSNDNGRGFAFGDEDNNFVFIEANTTACNINRNDYFLVTRPLTNTTSISHIIKYKGADFTNNRAQFRPSTGAKGQPSFDAKTTPPFHNPFTAQGQGTLTIAGDAFQFRVCTNGSIAVDQNQDGIINLTPVRLVTAGGAIFDFGQNNTIQNAFNMTLITDARKLESRGTDQLQLTIQPSHTGEPRTVDFAVNRTLLSPDDAYAGKTRYIPHPYNGILTIPDIFSTTRELHIDWPLEQTLGRAYVASGNVQSRPLNTLPIQITQAQDYTPNNAHTYFIGSPCTNTHIARLLNTSCEAFIGYTIEHHPQHTIIAGKTQEDTARALDTYLEQNPSIWQRLLQLIKHLLGATGE